MKFTLKNRPKTCFKESSFSKWFEGFEKELRKIQKTQIQKSHTYKGDLTGFELAKEILGE